MTTIMNKRQTNLRFSKNSGAGFNGRDELLLVRVIRAISNRWISNVKFADEQELVPTGCTTGTTSARDLGGEIERIRF